MATKKQKREAALAKREQFLKETRESGLKAQAEDKHNREIEKQAMAAEAKKLNDHYQAILENHGIYA